MTTRWRIVTRSADVLGENPVWDHRSGELFWVDIRRRALHGWTEPGRSLRSWTFDALCCGVALAADGLVLALGNRIVLFDPTTERCAEIGRVEADKPHNRINEFRCDRFGTLWFGTMRDFARATDGALYRFDGKGPPALVLAGVTVPNSLGWSPDGLARYFADTPSNMISVTASGQNEAPLKVETFATGVPLAGRPDGLAVDGHGDVWSARHGAHQLTRLSAGGEVLETVMLPPHLEPTGLAFGSTMLDVLYVTTATQGLAAHVANHPDAGALLALEVDVPGLRDGVFDVAMRGTPDGGLRATPDLALKS